MAHTGFKKILNAISPEPVIGGLEITDSNLRYTLIKGNKVDFVSVKLPPGIISEGRVKDKEKILGYLLGLKDQVSKQKKSYIILNIPDGNFYTEIFSVPKASDSNIEEAIKLNIQMISPIDFNNSYCDWEILGEKIENNNSQIEVFGAFIQKEVIDEYELLATQAGFEVVAVEFSLLSLVRSITRLEESFSEQNNYLLFKVGSEGLSFGLLKNSHLYFSHFVSWSSVYGEARTVKLDSLKKVIVDEIQKVLSFYETRWNDKLTNLFVVASTLSDEILKIITETYPNISPKIPVLSQFKNLSVAWFCVLGSALRGIIPRSQDSLISLASTGTENKFKHYQIISFIKIWRNIILSSLGFAVIVLGIFDGFLAARLKTLAQIEQNFAVRPEMAQITQFQAQAESFNKKVDTVMSAQEIRSNWSKLISNIQAVSGENIRINHLTIQPSSNNNTIIFIGSSKTEEEILNFKKEIEKNPNFSNIAFQVSDITIAFDGGFNFTMGFNALDVK